MAANTNSDWEDRRLAALRSKYVRRAERNRRRKERQAVNFYESVGSSWRDQHIHDNERQYRRPTTTDIVTSHSIEAGQDVSHLIHTYRESIPDSTQIPSYSRCSKDGNASTSRRESRNPDDLHHKSSLFIGKSVNFIKSAAFGTLNIIFSILMSILPVLLASLVLNTLFNTSIRAKTCQVSSMRNWPVCNTSSYKPSYQTESINFPLHFGRYHKRRRPYHIEVTRQFYSRSPQPVFQPPVRRPVLPTPGMSSLPYLHISTMANLLKRSYKTLRYNSPSHQKLEQLLTRPIMSLALMQGAVQISTMRDKRRLDDEIGRLTNVCIQLQQAVVEYDSGRRTSASAVLQLSQWSIPELKIFDLSSDIDENAVLRFLAWLGDHPVSGHKNLNEIYADLMSDIGATIITRLIPASDVLLQHLQRLHSSLVSISAMDSADFTDLRNKTAREKKSFLTFVDQGNIVKSKVELQVVTELHLIGKAVLEVVLESWDEVILIKNEYAKIGRGLQSKRFVIMDSEDVKAHIISMEAVVQNLTNWDMGAAVNASAIATGS